MSHYNDIKNTFLKYYNHSDRGHAVIEGVPLVAQNDPTLIFVNSGMFPLVPYLSGVPHPLGKRIANVQKCIRTDIEDFEEIGDKRHTTIFNMLGNWSLGDYFKKEQINWVLDLYVKEFGLDIDKIYISVFEGNSSAPKDNESIEIWKDAFKRYGIEAIYSDNPTDVQKNFDNSGKLFKKETNQNGLIERYKIFAFPEKKNWWKRGYAPGELGGPDSEIFFDLGVEAQEYIDPNLNINSDNNRFLEIGNNVFMQYRLDDNLKWVELPQKNVDFGGGLERVMMCQMNMKSGTSDMFEIETFQPLIKAIDDISGLSYEQLKKSNSKDEVKAYRVIADHLRASILIIGEGVIPSNKEHGYILRRFIRRAIRFAKNIGIEKNFTKILANKVIDAYSNDEPQLIKVKENILSELDKEETKFRITLEKGLKELENILKQNEGKENVITSKEVFTLYESFGFPIELTIEEIKKITKLDKNFEINLLNELAELKKYHQNLSRVGAEKKFKGGLADTSDITTALHTTHHLLLASLQRILDKNIHQKGSNITAERLRLDFNYGNKLREEQIASIENQVNEWINTGFKVERKDMKKEEASKLGAEMEFGKNYGDIVSVYVITLNNGEVISREFCGGPHISSSNELKKYPKFKIIKEEASGSGVRRIKAKFQ